MKERPILFSSPMVRAILDGRKTQTRRVVKLQPPAGHELCKHTPTHDWRDQNGTSYKCPYGQPGDRLWVRETWAHETDFGTATGGFMYRATYTNGGPSDNVDKWRPSIFMPRQASRITLELTGVRGERVQDISEVDAIAEGCTHTGIVGVSADEIETARDQFERLWDSINATRCYGWSVNPWVWVLTFRRIKQ